jgi:hypothetical protein
MKTKIEFTRVNNDVNGNPRYVCHFLDVVKLPEHNAWASRDADGNIIMNNEQVSQYLYGMSVIDYCYQKAVKMANTIGGRKFHNKQYGGGIVFQSYNIADTEKSILNLLK